MLFDKKFFNQHQSKLLSLLNNPVTRDWFRYCLQVDCKGRIDHVTSNSITQIKGLDKDKLFLSTEFCSHDKYAKRLFYAFHPLWNSFHIWDMKIANRFQPAWNFGFDSLTKYPDADPETTTVDGRVIRLGVNETFSTLCAGAGNYGESSASIFDVYLQASTTFNQFQRLGRGIFLFDTSSLTANANISAVTISLYVTTNYTYLGSNSVDIVSSNPASNTDLVIGDYGNLGAISFANVLQSAMSLNVYNVWTLNASGKSNISKTNISKFGIRFNWDLTGSFTGTWSMATYVSDVVVSSADATGTSQDPKLLVTYTLPIVRGFPILQKLIRSRRAIIQ